jgi:hypothetical protein
VLAALEQTDALTLARSRVQAEKQRLAQAQRERDEVLAAVEREKQLAEQREAAGKALAIFDRIAEAMAQVDEFEEVP